VGILRESGSTNFNLPRVGESEPPRDDLLQAVREASAGEFEVFGEISRGEDGSVVYLARDLVETRLVVLRLTSSGAEDFYLEVVRELDSSVAAPEGLCVSCQSPLREWGRYCTRCGADLWGDPSFSGEWSRQELLQAVKEMAAGQFEILGEIPRAEGGGFVYFGRDVSTGKVAALRLLKEDADVFSLGQTGLLRRVATRPPPERAGPQEPPARPLPAEPSLPDPVLPDVLGPAPATPIPPSPKPRPLAPRQPAYADQWAQFVEFLRQPIVLAIIAITMAVVLVTLCTIALSPGGSDEVATTDEVTPPAEAERTDVAHLQETVLGYSIVIASFGSLEEATERQREMAGVSAMYYTAPTTVSGSVHFRLYAAMLHDRDDASAFLSRLVSEGVKAGFRDWDIRPTAFAFFLGSHTSRREADAAIARLLDQGIPAYRVPAASGGAAAGYHVYAGGFETAQEAQYLHDVLARVGLDAELVERVGLPVP
jgi:hypothetical protein